MTHQDREPRPGPRAAREAPPAAQILGMIAIGLLSVVFAPIAIPIIIWVRLRDRRN